MEKRRKKGHDVSPVVIAGRVIANTFWGKAWCTNLERTCRRGEGLFPAPAEIKLTCSCPDWAGMCKHVAAVLYGVGARLDAQPELLFRLRGVEEAELLAHAGQSFPHGAKKPAKARV